ncbi:MAG: PEP-CTERM sorting domain-containing protein [Pirellulales bacterium]|nr:PEP-CTERM sorting domain-containing protein [Pirellulales bacterium]
MTSQSSIAPRPTAVRGFGAVALVALWAVAPAPALIIASGNGQGNTTAPVDDPGWNNIGRLHGSGAGTFIYLGNKKVLTAAHIGLSVVSNQSQVRFGGVPYTPVANSGVRLLNPDNSQTDLLVFEIDADPGLPAVKISQSTPANGSDLVLIGEGLNRQTSQFYWDVDQSNPNSWAWTEVNANDPWDATGFKWGGSVTRRWGTNEMTDNDVDFVGLGSVQGFAMRFDIGATTHEAAAAAGDSGGAVFYKNLVTNQWELSGVMIGVGYPDGWSNVPNQSAVSGGAHTLAADLSVYRDQIVALVPEPGTIVLMVSGLPLIWLARRRLRSVRC